MAVCPLILNVLHISSQKWLFLLIILASQTFYPNWPIFLHGYIRHIRDIFQLWSRAPHPDRRTDALPHQPFLLNHHLRLLLLLNHNAFLIFIIISLFLPSHSYALTSFFSCFLFSFAFHNINGMTLKIIHTQYLACSN